MSSWWISLGEVVFIREMDLTGKRCSVRVGMVIRAMEDMRLFDGM